MKPIDQLTDDEFAHLAQRAARLPDAPPAWVEAAVALWPASATVSVKASAAGSARAPVPGTPSPLAELGRAAARLVVAVLRFDSAAQPPVALGMRAVASDTRHLLFSASGRDIDLRISPAAGQFALTGQILGPDAAGVVELAASAGEDGSLQAAQVASLDDFGEFRLEGVRGGTYRLTLRVGDEEIVVSPIDIGPPRS